MKRFRYVLPLLLVALAACKCSAPPPVPPPTLVEVVASPFDVMLEKKQGIVPAVKTFLDQTKDETSKAGLADAWNAVAVLASQFKLEEIYQEAEKDSSWGRRVREADMEPDEVPDSVYVTGVRQGLTEWLEENG